VVGRNSFRDVGASNLRAELLVEFNVVAEQLEVLARCAAPVFLEEDLWVVRVEADDGQSSGRLATRRVDRAARRSRSQERDENARRLSSPSDGISVSAGPGSVRPAVRWASCQVVQRRGGWEGAQDPSGQEVRAE
jgi:hypothetical protein